MFSSLFNSQLTQNPLEQDRTCNLKIDNKVYMRGGTFSPAYLYFYYCWPSQWRCSPIPANEIVATIDRREHWNRSEHWLERIFEKPRQKRRFYFSYSSEYWLERILKSIYSSEYWLERNLKSLYRSEYMKNRQAQIFSFSYMSCLLYTSDAADE